MSWNSCGGCICNHCAKSASSWGCELKFPLSTSIAGLGVVSLFVRLWVEISKCFIELLNLVVSLFVRLWVEIWDSIPSSCYLTSASSWGCELKYWFLLSRVRVLNVSLFVRLWVEITTLMRFLKRDIVSLFVRLWVEILKVLSMWIMRRRQPLREAVSWNRIWTKVQLHLGRVSLFVRLWVEMTRKLWDLPRSIVSLFVRLWVEILASALPIISSTSASSWGWELKYL